MRHGRYSLSFLYSFHSLPQFILVVTQQLPCEGRTRSNARHFATSQDGSFDYVKLHIKSNQGNQYLTSAEARQRAGTDPDHMSRSLFEDIETGNFPSWDVYGQIIGPEVAERYPVDIFDPTKTLPSKDFPYRPFGRIVLNKNVEDQFGEVEQAAFSPANVVPGWALSPDPSAYLIHIPVKCTKKM